ncbi:MAG: hypothetical protein HUU20_13345 [Pirellulales bacterium]|nr:hypothetical protein [Pirellulales bacterium]
MKITHALLASLLLVSAPSVVAAEPSGKRHLQIVSGQARLDEAKGEGRNGNDVVSLEFTQWSPQCTAHAAVVFADNDGFSPKGAIPCVPGSRHLLSFWVKGDVQIQGRPGTHRTTLNNLAVAMDHEFFSQLRKLVLTKRPSLWLSANASGGLNADWHLGRDWPTWGRRGWIDFFVPQIYTENPIRFERLASQAQSLLGDCDLLPGIGLSWDGIYPKRLSKDVFQAQFDIASRLKCPGYVIFHEYHAEPQHWEVLQKADKMVKKSPLVF